MVGVERPPAHSRPIELEFRLSVVGNAAGWVTGTAGWLKRLAGGARARRRSPRPVRIPRVDVIDSGSGRALAKRMRGSQWFVPRTRPATWVPSGSAEGIDEGPLARVAVVEADAPQLARALAARRVAVLTHGGNGSDVWPAATDPIELKASAIGLASQREWRDRVAHLQRREVLAAAESAARLAPPRVSMLVSTNRPDKVDNVLAYASRQVNVEPELVLVTHGFKANAAAVSRARKAAPDLTITTVPADSALTLGSCLNAGIDAAGGDWIVKMDDDNFYGAHFLEDLARDARLSGAAITGKLAHFVYLEASRGLILRFAYEEHRFARIIQGGTMFLQGDFARDARFGDLPRAVDTDLLNRCRADGLTIYSSDRYNFLSMRMADTSAHTWQVSDASLLTGSGSLLFYGDAREHAEI